MIQRVFLNREKLRNILTEELVLRLQYMGLQTGSEKLSQHKNDKTPVALIATWARLLKQVGPHKLPH